MECDKCYKLCLDIGKIDLNIIVDKLAEIGDIMIYQNMLYIWLNDANNKKTLMAKLKKLHISECYCQLIIYDDIQSLKDYLGLWFIEHYRMLEQRYIEEQKQDKLKEMLSNIEKAKQLLQECKQQSTQQAVNTVEEKNTKV